MQHITSAGSTIHNKEQEKQPRAQQKHTTAEETARAHTGCGSRQRQPSPPQPSYKADMTIVSHQCNSARISSAAAHPLAHSSKRFIHTYEDTAAARRALPALLLQQLSTAAVCSACHAWSVLKGAAAIILCGSRSHRQVCCNSTVHLDALLAQTTLPRYLQAQAPPRCSPARSMHVTSFLDWYIQAQNLQPMHLCTTAKLRGSPPTTEHSTQQPMRPNALRVPAPHTAPAPPTCCWSASPDSYSCSHQELTSTPNTASKHRRHASQATRNNNSHAYRQHACMHCTTCRTNHKGHACQTARPDKAHLECVQRLLVQQASMRCHQADSRECQTALCRHLSSSRGN